MLIARVTQYIYFFNKGLWSTIAEQGNTLLVIIFRPNGLTRKPAKLSRPCHILV